MFSRDLTRNHLLELLKAYPDKEWNWSHVSENHNITLQYIKDNPELTWNWYHISLNPNTTIEIINDNPDKPWDWGWISYNPNLTIEIINDNPDKECDWEFVSVNKFNQHPIVKARLTKIKLVKECIYNNLAKVMIKDISKLVAEYM